MLSLHFYAPGGYQLCLVNPSIHYLPPFKWLELHYQNELALETEY